MSTLQTPQPRGEKERLVVVIPADLAYRVREVARRTGVPISLLVAIALNNTLNNLHLETITYTRAKVKKRA